MLRIRPFAVAKLVVCATIAGATLAGCSSSGSSSDWFKPSPPPPQVIRFELGAARRERSDRARSNLFDAMCAGAADEQPSRRLFAQRLRPAVNSAFGPAAGRLLVQHPAAEFGAEPGRGSAASGPSPAAQGGQAEAAQDGRKAKASRAKVRRAAAGDDDGTHAAIDRRPRAAAGAGQRVPAAAAAEFAVALPAAAATAITASGTHAVGKHSGRSGLYPAHSPALSGEIWIACQTACQAWNSRAQPGVRNWSIRSAAPSPISASR